MKSAYILLMTLACGCSEQKRLPTPEAEVRFLQNQPLTFDTTVPHSVTRAAQMVRGAIIEQLGIAPVVFLERGYRAKTNGTYYFNSSYTSLGALASHMNNQSTAYTWEVRPSGNLFIYPSTGSFLEETVGAFQAEDTTFCPLLAELSEVNHTNRVSTCMYSGSSMVGRKVYIPDALDLANTYTSNTFSVSFTQSGTRVLDVFDDAVQQIGRFDATGTRFSANGLPRWTLHFYAQ